MADVFTKAKRSEVMSRIRSRGNKETELALAKLLRANGISGWRRHWEIRKAESGKLKFKVRPDFVFPKLRVVILVDGCFWHCCPKHSNVPVNNREFWERKLASNRVRDRLVTRVLRRANWRVLRIWEHELAEEARRQKAGVSGRRSMVSGQKGGPGRLVRKIRQMLDTSSGH